MAVFNMTGTGGSGGVDTSDATASAADIALGKTAYIATGKVVGTNTGVGAKLYLKELVSHTRIDSTLQLESDCYFNPAVTLSDFTITGTSGLTGVTYVSSNLVNFSMAFQPTGTQFTIKALANAFLNTNGDSEVITITIVPLTIAALIDRVDLTTLKATGLSDSGVVSITSGVPFPYSDGTSSNAITTNGDTLTNLGSYVFQLNNRDNSYMYVYYQEGTLDNPACNFIKLIWDGCAPYSPYNDTTKFRFEFYWLTNGDAFVHLDKASATWDGLFTFADQTYTINMANPDLAFYADGPLGRHHTQAYEIYDPTHVHNTDKIFTTISAITNIADNMELFNFISDDGTIKISFMSKFTWRYNGSNIGYLIFSGNSWIGIGASTEDVKFCRMDNRVDTIYVQLGTITLGSTTQKFWKCRWRGTSPYNGTTDNLIWELILFENGDAQITSVAQPSGGVYTFLGVTYTITVGASISFYRQNTEGTSWVQATELYDITKHAL